MKPRTLPLYTAYFSGCCKRGAGLLRTGEGLRLLRPLPGLLLSLRRLSALRLLCRCLLSGLLLCLLMDQRDEQ